MHPNETAINDYVEGTSDPVERSRVEQHLATCAACRQLADDLREIARATASLELREPPVRAWGRIERAIALERDASAPPSSGARAFQASGNDAANDGLRSTGRARYGWAPWLAAAAVLVLATVVGLRFLPGRGQTDNASTAVESTRPASAADAIERSCGCGSPLRKRHQGPRADRQHRPGRASTRRPPPPCRRTSP